MKLISNTYDDTIPFFHFQNFELTYAGFYLIIFEITMVSKYTAEAKYLCKGFQTKVISQTSTYVMIKYYSLLTLLLDICLLYKVPKLLTALKNYLLTSSSYR